MVNHKRLGTYRRKKHEYSTKQRSNGLSCNDCTTIERSTLVRRHMLLCFTSMRDNLSQVIRFAVLLCISSFGLLINKIKSLRLLVPNPIPYRRLNFDSLTEGDYYIIIILLYNRCD